MIRKLKSAKSIIGIYLSALSVVIDCSFSENCSFEEALRVHLEMNYISIHDYCYHNMLELFAWLLFFLFELLWKMHVTNNTLSVCDITLTDSASVASKH